MKVTIDGQSIRREPGTNNPSRQHCMDRWEKCPPNAIILTVGKKMLLFSEVAKEVKLDQDQCPN
jgi:hypothetical protein